MKKVDFKTAKFYVADFETSVYTGQKETEVWAAALTSDISSYDDEVSVFNNIEDFLEECVKRTVNDSAIVYFHNLKFDGSFILSCLLRQGFKVPEHDGDMPNPEDLPIGDFTYNVNSMGAWYSITIRTGNNYLQFRDSLKLLPFSVEKIGKDFKTPHQKLSIEYTGERHAYGLITDEEKEYIRNDVLVVKEALQIMFEEGHKKLTIGSCCMEEFKKTLTKAQYAAFFPLAQKMLIDKSVYGHANIDEYVRASYHGGWCYVVKGKEKKPVYNGTTADVNSLYPSMMSSESGNYYPVGEGFIHKAINNEIPEQYKDTSKWYYFVRLKTSFRLKKGYLPFIQLKNNPLYSPNECLESSDWIRPNGEVRTHYIDENGQIQPIAPEMVLSCTDFDLIQKHYDLSNTVIYDYVVFRTIKGVFDKYIDKYRQIKMKAKGAQRQLAKLFLNNLYGKFATSPLSYYKEAYIENNILKWKAKRAEDREGVYIPIGAAITSYARAFTITAAQANYHGVDKPGFIYADTDSIHCDLPPSKITGIKVDPNAFCCWKLESCWDKGIFVRAKTYIEHVTEEDCEPIDKPYYNIKCCGMPDTCKAVINRALIRKDIERITGVLPPLDKTIEEKYENDELSLEIMRNGMNLEDFKIGLEVGGKLMPRQIPGGTLLVETTFKMRSISL